MHRVIDLSLAYSEKFKNFSKCAARTLKKDGWNASTLKFYSHCGTHIDAPIHFNVSNKTIDEMEVSNFIGRAWVVNATSKVSAALLTSDQIDSDIKSSFRKGDSLIFRTDWYKHVNTPKYRNELPRISEELANWCIEHQVKMLGVEPPSVADVNNLDEVTKIHRLLLGKVVIIEGLAHLDQIQDKCIELIALPLKIEGGDGAPARVIAIEKY